MGIKSPTAPCIRILKDENFFFCDNYYVGGTFYHTVRRNSYNKKFPYLRLDFYIDMEDDSWYSKQSYAPMPLYSPYVHVRDEDLKLINETHDSLLENRNNIMIAHIEYDLNKLFELKGNPLLDSITFMIEIYPTQYNFTDEEDCGNEKEGV